MSHQAKSELSLRIRHYDRHWGSKRKHHRSSGSVSTWLPSRQRSCQTFTRNPLSLLNLNGNGRLLSKPAVTQPVRLAFRVRHAKTTQRTMSPLSKKKLRVEHWTESSALQFLDRLYRRRYLSYHDAPHRQTFPLGLP